MDKKPRFGKFKFWNFQVYFNIKSKINIFADILLHKNFWFGSSLSSFWVGLKFGFT